VLEDSHDHKKPLGRPGRNVISGATEEDPPATGEDQSLEKDAPQDPNSSKASEAEEQGLKELEEQLILKQKELKKCYARAREKSLKQREEAEAALRNLNEQLQSASHEVIKHGRPKFSNKSFSRKEFSKIIHIN
jgi:hypothetical protein